MQYKQVMTTVLISSLTDTSLITSKHRTWYKRESDNEFFNRKWKQQLKCVYLKNLNHYQEYRNRYSFAKIFCLLNSGPNFIPSISCKLSEYSFLNPSSISNVLLKNYCNSDSHKNLNYKRYFASTWGQRTATQGRSVQWEHMIKMMSCERGALARHIWV